MSQFRIENLEFCQITRSENAKIVAGAFGPVQVVVRASVTALTRVRGLEATAGAAAAGAAAASIGDRPLVVVSTEVR
ncbi:hypothetical protein V0288_20525 [Pannus brasiliensis CCIBt3594]|uniref:Uncharacterized protein n=1 Tax=Pannus brasiliensis CCIBt3594 TaxID=1427578 RepID=A0AAW9QVY1_9CHRO